MNTLELPQIGLDDLTELNNAHNARFDTLIEQGETPEHVLAEELERLHVDKKAMVTFFGGNPMLVAVFHFGLVVAEHQHDVAQIRALVGDADDLKGIT